MSRFYRQMCLVIGFESEGRRRKNRKLLHTFVCKWRYGQALKFQLTFVEVNDDVRELWFVRMCSSKSCSDEND